MDASEETGCEVVTVVQTGNRTIDTENQTNNSQNQTNNSENQTNNSKNQTNNSKNQSNNSKYGPKLCKKKCNKILVIVSLVVAIVALIVCIVLRYAYPWGETSIGLLKIKTNCGHRLITANEAVTRLGSWPRSKRWATTTKVKTHYDEAKAVWAMLVLGLAMAIAAVVMFCIKKCRKCNLAIFLLALVGIIFSAIGLIVAIYLIADCESDLKETQKNTNKVNSITKQTIGL